MSPLPRALDAEVRVTQAHDPALVATVDGLHGRVERAR